VIRRVAIGVTMLMMLSTASVSAAPLIIQIDNFAYIPASATVQLGRTVKWHNAQSPTNHTSTSDVAGIWNLGVAAGATVGRAFNVAGSFAYHCTIHAGMHGTVKVRLTSDRASGPLGTLFHIRWAVNNGSGDWVYDAQQRKVGGTFKPLQTGVWQADSFFEPMSRGTFEIRARLRKVGGSASGWSPLLQIKVT